MTYHALATTIAPFNRNCHTVNGGPQESENLTFRDEKTIIDVVLSRGVGNT